MIKYILKKKSYSNQTYITTTAKFLDSRSNLHTPDLGQDRRLNKGRSKQARSGVCCSKRTSYQRPHYL